MPGPRGDSNGAPIFRDAHRRVDIMRVLPNDRPHHVVLGLERQDVMLVQLLQLTLEPPRHIRNALELALLSIFPDVLRPSVDL